MATEPERAGRKLINPRLYVLETRRAVMAALHPEPANVRVVQHLYRAAIEDDLEGLLELCAPDVLWVYPVIESVTWSRAWQGHEEVARWAELHDEEDEVLDLRLDEYMAQDDRVVVLGSARMRTLATGREWATRFVHAATIQDGKIVRFEAYFDTAACREAHGLVAAA
jgi:ketosteroid isomerase-like protein